jgi:hypothetical protein
MQGQRDMLGGGQAQERGRQCDHHCPSYGRFSPRHFGPAPATEDPASPLSISSSSLS